MNTASSGHARRGKAAAPWSDDTSGASIRQGAVLQLLALCPLLAISDTLAKAIAMSGVILLVLPAAVVLSWSLRRWLDEPARLAAAAFLLAGLIACVELLLDAGLHELRLSLGVFLPLAAVNLVLLEQVAGFRSTPGTLPAGSRPPSAAACAPQVAPMVSYDPNDETRSMTITSGASHDSNGSSRSMTALPEDACEISPDVTEEVSPWVAVTMALRTAGGMALTLLLLGAARELAGHGSLLHDAHLLGTWASGLGIQLFRIDMGFLLAMLAPGAFLALGLLLALRKWLSRRRTRPAAESTRDGFDPQGPQRNT